MFAESCIICMDTTLGIAANLALKSFMIVKEMFMTVLIDLSMVLRSLVEAAILLRFCTCGPWRLFLIADTMAFWAKPQSTSFSAFMISFTASSHRGKSMLSLRIGRSFCLILDRVFLLLRLFCLKLSSVLLCSNF